MSAYKYMENPPSKKKTYRVGAGEVKTGPIPFLTMPMKKGRVQRRDPVEFWGPIKYMEDDYNVK